MVDKRNPLGYEGRKGFGSQTDQDQVAVIQQNDLQRRMFGHRYVISNEAHENMRKKGISFLSKLNLKKVCELHLGITSQIKRRQD